MVFYPPPVNCQAFSHSSKYSICYSIPMHILNPAPTPTWQYQSLWEIKLYTFSAVWYNINTKFNVFHQIAHKKQVM